MHHYVGYRSDACKSHVYGMLLKWNHLARHANPASVYQHRMTGNFMKQTWKTT